MPLIASTQSHEFEIIPSGTMAAICYRVIDLGTQLNKTSQKTEKKISLSWEFPDELMKDGRPFSIHKRYTLSLHEKAKLRKDLDSWRGVAFTEEELKGFDISKLLGKPCFLGVVHNVSGDKVYANISSVLAMPKGMPTPKQVNPSVLFDLGAFDQAVFDSLSDNMKAVIQMSPEYAEIKGTAKKDDAGVMGEFAPPDAVSASDLNDAIPF